MNPPASTSKHNGSCVKWPAFLTLLGIAVATAAGLNSFVWAQHANTMNQFEKRMVEQFENVKDRLNKIDSTIEKKCDK